MLRYSNVYASLVDAMSQSPMCRYYSCCGGTRSGKTYSILELIRQLAEADKTPTITSVVSETLPHLKRGAIRDFRSIIADQWTDGKWSKSDYIWTCDSGSVIEFFSADSPAKVHGPARDRLFINEAQNIPYDTFRQLAVRTKQFIIIDYNPTHSFFVNELIEPDSSCRTLHSTYLDNCDHISGESFLSLEQIREIERNRVDANWWRVYGEGKIGQFEGLIYDFEQVDAMPDTYGKIETYGMDFGFSNDPSTLIHTIIDNDRKEVFLDEIFYRTGMLNADIIAELEAANVPAYGVPIYADAADPKTIAELFGRGWNVKSCRKTTKVADQIHQCKGFKIYVTKRSLNLISELRGYVWQKDKNGKSLNEPIGINNHAADAFRYSIVSYFEENQSAGWDVNRMFGFGSDYP